jgi:hypothetical protein
MKIPHSLKSGSLDVLTGFLGLFLLLVLDFRTNIKFDLRWFFIVGGSFSFVLGFVRGGRAFEKPWLNGLLIISGFSIPLLILSFMGLAFGARAVLVTFLATSALLTLSGVQSRQNWVRDFLMDEQANPAVVQAIMRHSQMDMTLYYAHLSKKQKRAALDNYAQHIVPAQTLRVPLRVPALA